MSSYIPSMPSGFVRSYPSRTRVEITPALVGLIIEAFWLCAEAFTQLGEEFLEAMERKAARQRSRDALRGLSDHTLRDIGMERVGARVEIPDVEMRFDRPVG